MSIFDKSPRRPAACQIRAAAAGQSRGDHGRRCRRARQRRAFRRRQVQRKELTTDEGVYALYRQIKNAQ